MTAHVSFVLATHNRCECVCHTLAELQRCGLDRTDYQVIVVDNASSDQTEAMVSNQCDHFIRLQDNFGSCGKAFGLDVVTSPYVVFLDDDSFPRPGSVSRMISHFEHSSRLGAAGFAVHLPNKKMEGGALPHVFLGCGVGFRREALVSCGGLDRSFFMQAEEYDLAFRLAGSGWDVRMFDDIHVEHLKTEQARKNERTIYYDTRNNLRVASRYLPTPAYRVYLTDWLQRYAWLAQRDGHTQSFQRGSEDGRLCGACEHRVYAPARLSPSVFEQFFQWRFIDEKMADLVAEGVRRVVFADMGKNVYPFYRAARKHGLDLLAIGDDRFAMPDRCYRKTPIVTLQEALALNVDAVVVANCSAVHGAVTHARVRSESSKPVFFWHGASNTEQTVETTLLAMDESADKEIGVVAS